MYTRSVTRRLGALLLCALLLIVLFYQLFHGLLAVHAENPVVPNTIFPNNTTIAFTITTAGPTGTVIYHVTNLAGATIATGQAQVTNRRAQISLPAQPEGYYVLHVADHTAQTAAHQSISFAVVAPFTPSADSPFGVGTHFSAGNDPNLTPLITAMGATTIRDDVAWSSIEKVPGQYDFNGFDRFMNVLQQNNIDSLLILDYNNRFYDQGQTPYDNAGLSAFARYAQAVVSHYGPQLKAVEVYNEYNGQFSTGPCARKPSCYTTMLRYTYKAIKAIRPDVTVVGGALFSADLPWFTQLFQDGALPYMDVVSDHPYSSLYELSPELAGTRQQMADLASLIRQYNGGASKPIWITELGWPTSTLHVTERGQADYLVRSAVLSLASGVSKFFWYDFLNDGIGRFKIEQSFGLLRRPDAAGRYTPKPAYVAYAVLARKLADRPFKASEVVGWGIYDELFTNDLRVLWSTPVNRDVVVNTDNPITVTTMTGSTRTYTPIGGHIRLNLSGDPIYLQGSVYSVAND